MKTVSRTSPSNSSCNQTPKITRRAILARVAGGVAAVALSRPLSAKADQRDLWPKAVQRMQSKTSSLKQRASGDYQKSMALFGGQLSNAPEQLFYTSLKNPPDQFDVVVIGSGYGASICAARLAKHRKPGVRMAMIERGREWLPGTFKDTFAGINQQARNQLLGQKKRTVVNPLGLHNVVMNDEVNIWTGNGLGGGSLINAGIALKPDPEVFTQFKWPAALSDRAWLEPYYVRAAAGLNLTRTPFDMTSKVCSRRKAAEKLSADPQFYDLSPVAVTYDQQSLDADSRNPQGVIQRPCTLCGDCITGCNVGAKNTLATNYLPMAKRYGCEIYTQMEIRSIEQVDGLYRLNLVYFDDRECGIVRRYTSIYSRVVVLGAGSPGTPEILLKSQDAGGLCLSQALGHRWSGNGDTVGFVVDKSTISCIGGVGAYPEKEDRIGPTVQTSLRYSQNPQLEERILVQDAAIPRGATNLFRVLLRDSELNRSSVVLGMGHDGAIGRIEISEGRATIRWPGLKEAAFRKRIWQEFERIAAAEGGRYKRLQAFGDNLVSVHPLGGCAAADDPLHGVVNDLGQVFDGTHGGYADPQTGRAAVYPGLYIADGSIIPSSLGVNPLLTISALSERIAEGILNTEEHRDLFLKSAA